MLRARRPANALPAAVAAATAAPAGPATRWPVTALLARRAAKPEGCVRAGTPGILSKRELAGGRGDQGGPAAASAEPAVEREGRRGR